LDKLEQKWVEKMYSTLHIWLWTFKVVDIENIKKYDIHSETIQVPTNIFEQIEKVKNKNKNIIAVWTTSTRILETLPYLAYKLNIKNEFFKKMNITKEQADNFINWQIIEKNWFYHFDTKLFIYPWFEYKVIDKLITNFHLPKSSLLMLVSAFIWFDNMMNAYEHAIKQNYMFFSFWDAMFLEK
jgi:S-adenosylmethionine:tRNA ribosyltransferase-isomerase